MTIRTTNFPAMAPGTGSISPPASGQILPGDATDFAQAIQVPRSNTVPGQPHQANKTETTGKSAEPIGGDKPVEPNKPIKAETTDKPAEPVGADKPIKTETTDKPIKAETTDKPAEPVEADRTAPKDARSAYPQATEESGHTPHPGTVKDRESGLPLQHTAARKEVSPATEDIKGRKDRASPVHRTDTAGARDMGDMGAMGAMGNMANLMRPITGADTTGGADSAHKTAGIKEAGQAPQTLPAEHTMPKSQGMPLRDAAHFIESLREGQPLADKSTAQGSGQGQQDLRMAAKANIRGGTETISEAEREKTVHTSGSRGDAILHALGGMPPAETPPSLTAAGVTPATAPADLADMVGVDQRMLTQLVDSILVSAQEGKQEVHIKVQDAVLKDTSILLCMQDGHMEVRLQSSDPYSAQVLQQNVDVLRHALEGHKAGESVRVTVQERSAGQQTEGQGAGHEARQGDQQGQQDRRSRGNFLWDGQQG